MKVIINGKDTEVADGMTISAVLESLGLNPAAVVVEHNYNVPARDQWGEISLNEGDNIEIVRFMGGG